MHSTASDGTYAPARLMQMAAARGLSAVALTDHDTTAGLAEAADAARAVELEFVPGIEFAAEYARGTLHILGYFIDSAAPPLVEVLAEIVRERDQRNRRMAARLAGLSVRLPAEVVEPVPGGAVIGRPHLAHAIVRAGAAATFQEAFDRYLARGAASYVERACPTAERIIAVIRAAGGVAVLAHPSQVGYGSRLELETLLRRLIDAGLGGVEVVHPDHSGDQRRLYEDLADRWRLAKTGGSDFHALPMQLERGVGFGRVRVPHGWLTVLAARAGRTDGLV